MTEFADALGLVRSALFLPASNPRAIAKAQGLPADMVILDLEDAVRPEDKATARAAAVDALNADWGDRIVAVRINGTDSQWHREDVAALAAAHPALVVVPKVEQAGDAEAIATAIGAPVLAMIETPLGIYAAREIAAAKGVAGLIAGTNDIAAELRLPPESGRAGLTLALQSIVLAARAAGGVALDGVYNRLDDEAGLLAQCAEGWALGFDGKTLIHPSQIEPTNRAFAPSDPELEDARALVEAATGGAERFRGRMIEAMHVAMARRVIARARA